VQKAFCPFREFKNTRKNPLGQVFYTIAKIISTDIPTEWHLIRQPDWVNLTSVLAAPQTIRKTLLPLNPDRKF
jgi:hypothetical protein